MRNSTDELLGAVTLCNESCKLPRNALRHKLHETATAQQSGKLLEIVAESSFRPMHGISHCAMFSCDLSGNGVARKVARNIAQCDSAFRLAQFWWGQASSISVTSTHKLVSYNNLFITHLVICVWLC